MVVLNFFNDFTVAYSTELVLYSNASSTLSNSLIKSTKKLIKFFNDDNYNTVQYCAPTKF